MRIPLCSLLLVLPAFAQTVHVVDSTGAGGAFTTLEAAIAAATNGDVIEVRSAGAPYIWGLISPPPVVSKGLTIVGDASLVPFLGVLRISNLPASQRVVFRSFRAAVGQGTSSSVEVINCQGAVVLEQLNLSGVVGGFGGAHEGLTITGSANVSVKDCQIDGAPALRVAGSSVAVSNSAARSVPADVATFVSTGPGLVASASSVVMTGTLVVGGAEDVSFPGSGAPGVSMIGGSLRLAGGTLVGGGNVATAYDAATLNGSATLTRDSATNVSQPIVGGTQILAESGRVGFTSAAPGQNASFTMQGPAGAVGALFWALPIPPTQTPIGRLWGDPNVHVLVGVDVLPLSATLPIPAFSTVADVFVVQGILFDQGQIVLSNPVRSAVR